MPSTAACPYCGRDLPTSGGCYDDFCHFMQPDLGSYSRLMPITDDMLSNWFRYHAPSEAADPAKLQADYEAIRAAGGEFARVIRDLTPASADQTAAIRKVREAVWSANAAIACGGQ